MQILANHHLCQSKNLRTLGGCAPLRYFIAPSQGASVCEVVGPHPAEPGERNSLAPTTPIKEYS